jgi:hypothetical protein
MEVSEAGGVVVSVGVCAGSRDVGTGVSVWEAVGVSETEAGNVAVPVCVDDGVAGAVDVFVGNTKDVAVRVTVEVKVRVFVAVREAVAVCESVAVGERVGEAVRVGVLVGFGVAVGSCASTISWDWFAPDSRLARLSAVPLEVVRARL